MKYARMQASDWGAFKRADEPVKRRLVVALDGLEKSGKNHFAFTAPAPLAVISTDVGTEGVIQKFQGLKEMWVSERKWSPPRRKDNLEEAAAAGRRVWDALVEDYLVAMKRARSIVWDTGTEFWEVLRVARFGKLDQVKPHHYGPVNAEYRELLRMAYDSDHTNLIILHKRKDEYVNNEYTGGTRRAGFADTGFLVQVNGTTWRGEGEVPDCFHMTIADCRHDPALAGVDLSGEDFTFARLATLVLPETSEDDWI